MRIETWVSAIGNTPPVESMFRGTSVATVPVLSDLCYVRIVTAFAHSRHSGHRLITCTTKPRRTRNRRLLEESRACETECSGCFYAGDYSAGSAGAWGRG